MLKGSGQAAESRRGLLRAVPNWAGQLSSQSDEALRVPQTTGSVSRAILDAAMLPMVASCLLVTKYVGRRFPYYKFELIQHRIGVWRQREGAVSSFSDISDQLGLYYRSGWFAETPLPMESNLSVTTAASSREGTSMKTLRPRY
jgi:hypothetical protein